MTEDETKSYAPEKIGKMLDAYCVFAQYSSNGFGKLYEDLKFHNFNEEKVPKLKDSAIEVAVKIIELHEKIPSKVLNSSEGYRKILNYIKDTAKTF